MGSHKLQLFDQPQELSHLSRSVGSNFRLFLSLLDVVSSERSRLVRPARPPMLAGTELPHAAAHSPSSGIRLALLLAALRLRAEASLATWSPMTEEISTVKPEMCLKFTPGEGQQHDRCHYRSCGGGSGRKVSAQKKSAFVSVQLER